MMPGAAAPIAELKPGDLIGNYQIVQLLGMGGMGAVYEARHAYTERRAVVKVLLPDLSRDEEMARRFLNEARSAGDLAHRNIVTIYDFGREPDGRSFIAMAYLEGRSLEALVGFRGGVLSPDEVVSIIGQAANGLHAAHEAGIVHRDIKAPNIFVRDDGHVTVIDFGIAKLDKRRSGGGTAAGRIFGTPDHMAPEQLRGDEVDRRADVFALGTVAWQLLAGQSLWSVTGDEPAPAILEQQLRGERPLNPCAVRAGIPPTMGAAIAKALAFDRQDRYDTVADFAVTLAHGLPSDWGDTGIEILRRVAPELLLVGPNASTAGSPTVARHIAAPTLRAVAALGGLPLAAVTTPLGAPEGERREAPTAGPAIAPSPAKALPAASALPAPSSTDAGEEAAPRSAATVGVARPEVGTLGSLSRAAGERQARATAPDAPRGRQRAALLAAGGGLIGAVAITVAMLGSGGGRERASKAAAAPAVVGGPAVVAPASAAPVPVDPPRAPTVRSIVSDPPGASIYIDGAARGGEPVQFSAAAGADLELRAELAGYATTTERVRVTAAPATIRLHLAPLARPTRPTGTPPRPRPTRTKPTPTPSPPTPNPPPPTFDPNRQVTP